MELRQLQQFKEICACGTISKAAETLHISQPALSTALKKLEEELDVSLFVREHNRLELTADGRLVLTYTDAILSQLQLMQQSLQARHKHDKAIKILFCSINLMWYFTPLFETAHPEVELITDVFDEGIADAKVLIGRDADIIITTHGVFGNNITNEPFLRDKYLLSVDKDAALAHTFHEGITYADLTNQGVRSVHFLNQEHDAVSLKFRDFAAKYEPGISVVLYQDYFYYIQHMRKSGSIAVSTEITRRFRNDGENRVDILLREPELDIQYYLCYLKISNEKIAPVKHWRDYITQ